MTNITNPAETQFGWAYIGAGNIARQTADAIVKTGRHRIASVYNRTFSRSEEFAAQFGAQPCATIADALSAPGVQGAYIATTHDQHYSNAKQCLEMGVPALVEKAFTVTRAQAQELAELARAKGVYLAEAMWTWYSTLSRQIRELVQSGALGEIRAVELSYAVQGAVWLPRIFDPSTAGGALLDIGVYPIAYCYNLFGMPQRVECVGELENGIDTREVVTLHYPNISVACNVSLVNGTTDEVLHIVGSSGELRCENYHYASTATLTLDGSERVISGSGGYDNEFDVVASEIAAGRTESECVPLSATLDIMGILDECRAQLGLRYPFE